MFYNADRYDNQGYFYGDIAVASDPAGPFVPYNKYLNKNLVQIAQERNVNKSTVCRTLKRAENKLRRFLQY
jgi:hypothetical protein